MKYKIFLSFSHKDLAVATEVERSLGSNKLWQVFRAQYSPDLGTAIPKRIISKIKNSDLMLLIWSRNSIRSIWVLQEIGMALGSKPRVLPLIVTKGLELPDTLKGLKCISLIRNKSEILDKLRSLIEGLAKRRAGLQDGVHLDASKRRSASKGHGYSYDLYEDDVYEWRKWEREVDQLEREFE